MEKHPIEGLMQTAMANIKDMVDVNTIIGDAITTPDGTVIIPVSKVTFGFASGGSDFQTKVNTDNNLFGGGSGAGITITPIAFLVASNSQVRLLQVNEAASSAVDRLIAMIPDAFDAIKDLAKKKESKTQEADDEI